MFVSAVKLAIVEALRETVLAAGFTGDARFQSIDIEYPEQSQQWPSLLVQFHPRGSVSWTGVNPEEFTEAGELETFDWTGITKGYFEGSIDLTVLALTSRERDRLWDALIELLLMGLRNADTEIFFERLNNHDLIDMTVLPSNITPLGDSISPGTPWDPEPLSYEATVRIDVVGQFYASTYDRRLMSISEVHLYPYRDVDPMPGEEGEATGMRIPKTDAPPPTLVNNQATEGEWV